MYNNDIVFSTLLVLYLFIFSCFLFMHNSKMLAISRLSLDDWIWLIIGLAH